MSSALKLSRAAEIRRLHEEIGASVQNVLDKAIQIGGLLSAQKREVGHGKWLPWLEANCSFSLRAAEDYMRFYKRREELKSANLANLTGARQLLEAAEWEIDKVILEEDRAKKQAKADKRLPTEHPKAVKDFLAATKTYGEALALANRAQKQGMFSPEALRFVERKVSDVRAQESAFVPPTIRRRHPHEEQTIDEAVSGVISKLLEVNIVLTKIVEHFDQVKPEKAKMIHETLQRTVEIWTKKAPNQALKIARAVGNVIPVDFTESPETDGE